MESEFEKCVWEISGLTAYEPFTIPAWLRERLDANLAAPPRDKTTDRELMEYHLVGEEPDRWIVAWGTAVISGEEVLLFESNLNCSTGFFVHFEMAEMLECGAVFVERSRRYQHGAMMIYTEFRYGVRRDQPRDEFSSQLSSTFRASLPA